jgi:hypothetical protein
MPKKVDVLDFIRYFHSHYSKKENGCWEWTGYKNGTKSGYGRMYWNRRPNGKLRLEMAHRVSYFLHKGELISGMHVHHKCRNTSCVNPEHLEQITPLEHVHETPGCAGWISANSIHCKLGHELSGENLKITPSGSRKCVECSRIAARQYKKSRVFDRFTQERRLRSRQAEKTHCPLGHPYSGKNLKWRKDKHGYSRYCGTCGRIKSTYQQLKSRKGLVITIEEFLENWQKYGLKHHPSVCLFET